MKLSQALAKSNAALAFNLNNNNAVLVVRRGYSKIYLEGFSLAPFMDFLVINTNNMEQMLGTMDTVEYVTNEKYYSNFKPITLLFNKWALIRVKDHRTLLERLWAEVTHKIMDYLQQEGSDLWSTSTINPQFYCRITLYDNTYYYFIYELRNDTLTAMENNSRQDTDFTGSLSEMLQYLDSEGFSHWHKSFPFINQELTNRPIAFSTEDQEYVDY
jgi:hypothetical protein